MHTKAKVLFVDDEERVVNLLRRMFRLTHKVFTATSGTAALKIIAANDIQVIVSDQRMPGMTGLELLSAVRQRSPATLGILLADYSDRAAIADSVKDAGTFRFLNKPWNIDEIKAVVGEAAESALRVRDSTPPTLDSVLPSLDFPAAPASPATPALLVLAGSENDRLQMMEMFAEDYRVRGAADVAEALNVIEQHDVGVIVCEVHVGSKSNGPFLRILTLNYPMIKTVMLTGASDNDLVIKMIEQVQIFRFVMKPIIRPRLFQFAVSAAMKEHHCLRRNPCRISPISAARSTGLETLRG